jgi:hypothetical protein
MTAPSKPDDLPLDQRLWRSRTLEDAPEPVIDLAMSIFEPRARTRAVPPMQGSAPTGLLARLAAVLSFDSALATPQAAGLRSGAVATRQILFSSHGRDVDLRIGQDPAEAAASWRISGQVLGPDRAGWARLVGPGRVSEMPWSDLAEFRFDGVAEGRWVIELRTEQWELHLPPIQVPAES